MRTRPADLGVAELLAAVADGWDVTAASIDYVPEGGGAHHWKVVDASGSQVFVTVDDLDAKDWLAGARNDAFTGLQRAYETAAALGGEAALGFVVAPLVTVDGEVIRRLGARYAVSVHPFLDGHSFPYGPHDDPARRVQLLDMLAALHGATRSVDVAVPAHEPRVGGRRHLEAALRDEQPWTPGPFSERARALITAHAAGILEVLSAFDRLVLATAEARSRVALTHGEPHPANVMSVDGRLILIDWDTVALAPPERDLWMVSADADELARYTAATGHRVDPAVMTLYRLRWYLDDIGSVVRDLQRGHDDSEDARRWWNGLDERVALLPTWQAELADT